MENNNNNNNKKKLTWAVGLIAGLGILSIAYAVLSSTLNIEGTGSEVDIGHVHFTDKTLDSGRNNYCEISGIGSTNPEYYTGTISKFDRGEGNSDTGMIPSTSFSEAWAKALAEPGELSLSKSKKDRDKVTISGTKLNDYGSFVVYKLGIMNSSGNNMKLTKAPTFEIFGSSGSKYTEGDIEVKAYTDYDESNFVSPCKSEVKVYEESMNGSLANGNYLTPGADCAWYVKVSYKDYESVTVKDAGSIPFTFSVAPVWEAVM